MNCRAALGRSAVFRVHSNSWFWKMRLVGVIGEMRWVDAYPRKPYSVLNGDRVLSVIYSLSQSLMQCKYAPKAKPAEPNQPSDTIGGWR